MVRKEASHQIILGVTNETHGIAIGLIARETDGLGLSTKGFRRFDGQKKPATRDDKSHLKCEECGMNRHTKDQCFKIIGYPDWWTDGHKTASNKGAEKDKPSTSPTANTRKDGDAALFIRQAAPLPLAVTNKAAAPSLPVPKKKPPVPVKPPVKPPHPDTKY
nr:hypothetical protein [Tanacetum cinerariifolium]